MLMKTKGIRKNVKYFNIFQVGTFFVYEININKFQVIQKM